MKRLESRLQALMRAVCDEIERNPDFRRRVGEALGETPSESTAMRRPSRRRAPGAFNPIDVLREGGSDVLHERLGVLDLEGLKDIVAEHGMDGSKLAMKWKDPDRLRKLITDTSQSRLRRGDVFRS